MINRAQRKAIAEETVEILAQGYYTYAKGLTVPIASDLANAVECIRLYAPADLVVGAPAAGFESATPIIDVVNQTTLAGARDLLEVGAEAVCCLNFGSAMNPGGGFLGGSQAQEEALARASGLSACLEAAPKYYSANRAHPSALYTDHVIYTPDVPIFRDDYEKLLPKPWLSSFVTAPAPNAGAVRKNEPSRVADILPVLTKRAWRILEVCRVHGQRSIVLGAWGCGVFRNSPKDVAAIFRGELDKSCFAGAFDRVRFAVLDTKGDGTFEAFNSTFSDRI